MHKAEGKQITPTKRLKKKTLKLTLDLLIKKIQHYDFWVRKEIHFYKIIQ